MFTEYIGYIFLFEGTRRVRLGVDGQNGPKRCGICRLGPRHFFCLYILLFFVYIIIFFVYIYVPATRLWGTGLRGVHKAQPVPQPHENP